MLFLGIGGNQVLAETLSSELSLAVLFFATWPLVHGCGQTLMTFRPFVQSSDFLANSRSIGIIPDYKHTHTKTKSWCIIFMHSFDFSASSIVFLWVRKTVLCGTRSIKKNRVIVFCKGWETVRFAEHLVFSANSTDWVQFTIDQW